MTLKQLRAFMAVARTRSFAEAGELVFQSQPALSIAIRNLEDELGGRLLTRTTRSVALTPEGEELYALGQRLLGAWDSAEDELRQRFQLRRGRVAIAAMPSFASTLLPQALLSFHQKHPNLAIEVHDVIAETVVTMVRSGQLELGVTFEPDLGDDLHFEPLFNDEFIAIVPAQHPLAKRQEVSWSELLQDQFIMLQRPSALRQLIEYRLARQGLELSVAFEAHQLVTVGRMVAIGMGVSAVPSLCQAQMSEIGACCLRLSNPVIARSVGVLTRRRYQLSVAAEAMVAELRDQFRASSRSGTPAESC